MKMLFGNRILPVVVIDNADDAVPLAEALHAGGLNIVEVTFRTAAAAPAIRHIKRALPAMHVGAGTILDRDQLQRARDAGAEFAVAPGLNETVVSAARELGVPFVPGVMTPSEVGRALALGCSLLKFFPAEAAGGVAMLKSLAGPYEHTGVKFIPLGGVTMMNGALYLALPIVAAIGGTWIAERPLIARRDWTAIKERAASAAALCS